jgi:hypothetical protein
VAIENKDIQVGNVGPISQTAHFLSVFQWDIAVHVPRMPEEHKVGNRAIQNEFLVDGGLQRGPYLVVQQNPVLVPHFVRRSLETKDTQSVALFEAALATCLINLRMRNLLNGGTG